MHVPNTDLLPPLFDRILAYFDVRRPGHLLREDIVKGLENGIVNAAATRARRHAVPSVQSTAASASSYGSVSNPATTPGADPLGAGLVTSDRLSGADISRAALIQQLQTHTGLDPALLEIALLLVEAQIDLRLTGGESFKIAGVRFSLVHGERHRRDIAEWCRSLLGPALQSAVSEKPSLWPGFRPRKPAGIRVLVETMQLSATLRDAVPYEIAVDRHLVEPLLAEPRSDQRIRLLHISDLHLSAELTEPGRKLARPLLAPTHSFDTARLVASAVWSLQPRYDAVVATGDLSTDGARDSFETVLQYVQSGSITGANPMRIAAYGLNASRSQRILVPGNHDRFAQEAITGQRLSHTFEEVLATPRGYPYMLGYRPHGRAKDALTLLFLVFDSSLAVGHGPSGTDPRMLEEALARGEISDAEMLRARDLAKEAAQRGSVERIGGGVIEFQPEKTIRIALLHHHPVERYEKPTTPADTFGARLRETFLEPFFDRYRQHHARSMAMEHSDAFLRCCFDCGVQLILFGHQHHPYQRLIVDGRAAAAPTPFGSAAGHMRAFCCPTTLQYDAPANGFYLFDFESETRVDWAMYGNFRKQGEPAAPMKLLSSRSYDLDRPPAPEELDEGYTLND